MQKKINMIMLFLVILGMNQISVAQKKELTDRRTYFSKTYINPDNSYTTSICPGPIHYQTDEGVFEDIKLEIVPSSNTDYNYEMTTGLYNAYFMSDITADFPIVFETKAGNNLKFGLKALVYYDNSSGKYQILEEINQVPLEIDRNRITFNRVFKNADLKYIYRPTSIEELLILNQEGRTSLPDPDLFGMNKNQTYLMIMSKIDLNGTLAAHALDEKKIQKKDVDVDDLIKFKDIKGNTKFFMPSDFAYTATANQDTSGMTKLEKMKRKILYKESEYYLFSGIPLKWLENQPTGDIVFDPIVELNFQPNNTEGYDNYLIYRENYSAYETYNAGSHSDLRVGRTYGNDFYIFRGLLKFDLSSIPTNVNIVSSILNLYAYYCSPYTGSTTIDIHKMNIYWEEGSQSYSPGKSNWHYRTQSDEWSQSGCQSGVDYESMVYATKTLTLSDDDSWIEFDIKDLTEYWVQNQSSNYGMMIKYQDDDVTITDNLHRYFRFYSSDATSNRPLLEVIYFEQETVTTYYVRDAAGNVIATYKR